MNKPQLVVEVLNVEFHCSNREEALEQLMFLWANGRGLPYIEHIKRIERMKTQMNHPCGLMLMLEGLNE